MPPLRKDSRTSANIACMSKANLTAIITKRQPITTTRCGICPKFCAFCEMWKLVLFLSSRVHSPNNRPKSVSSSVYSIYNRRSASEQSAFRAGTLTDEYPNEKLLDALYSLRRSRLASMITLNTLEELGTELGWQADNHSVPPPRASTY